MSGFRGSEEKSRQWLIRLAQWVGFKYRIKSSVPEKENGHVPETGPARHSKTMADQANQSKGAVKQKWVNEPGREGGNQTTVSMPNLFLVFSAGR